MMIGNLSVNTILWMGIISYLVTTFFLISVIWNWEIKKEKKVILFCSVVFVVNVFLLQGFDTLCVEMVEKYPFSTLSKFMMNLWYVPIAIIMITTFGISVWLWFYAKQKKVEALTASSVREGLDMMSDGICFSTMEGIPLLANKQMQNICYVALGAGVMDTNLVSQKIFAGELQNHCRIEQKGNGVFLHLPDQSVWNIQRNELKVHHKKIWEYLAYNVTEQYNKGQELEKRNQRLEMVNNQLRIYHSHLNEIIREKEILDAKIRVHDDVGKSLLALRAYLAQENRNRKQLVELWKQTLALLKREAEIEEPENEMHSLLKAAEAVGVRIVFEGMMPESSKINKILLQAIHESLTNTVKHAEGSVLKIQIEQAENEVFMKITNDGKPPKGSVEEKGGLRNLRSTVEMHGGTMEIKSVPEFQLKIKLTGEEQTYE